MIARWALALVVGLGLVGCSDDEGPQNSPIIIDEDVVQQGDNAQQNDLSQADTDEAQTDADPIAEQPFGGERPARVLLPEQYSEDRSWPLVMLLHGYTATGAVQDSYLGVSAQRNSYGFVTVIPDGKKDASGRQFWNATDFCCDFGRTGVDDVAYLGALIEEAKQRYNIDASRVYLIGHSNGGFMSYRLACELGDQITAIASLAGTTFLDDAKCTGSDPVAVLQIHGTLDATIAYDGAANQYPGAEPTVASWVERNGCAPDGAAGEALDLVGALAGAETDVTTWTGCDGGTSVALWKINSGGHIPIFQGGFMPAVLDFLMDHQKP